MSSETPHAGTRTGTSENSVFELGEGFRAAMRRLAATVNVITVWDGAKPLGMTATAVSSLSADPPSVLFCINRSASMHAALSCAPMFCVNVLHREQEDVAKTFSDSALRDVRFATGAWIQPEDEPPYLRKAQAVILCERIRSTSFETHDIFIGRVRDVHFRQEVDPLIYIDGRFSQIR